MPPQAATTPKPFYELKKPAEIQNTTATPPVKATITILQEVYPNTDIPSAEVYSFGHIATVKGITGLPETTQIFVKIYLPDEKYGEGNDEFRADREVWVYQRFEKLQKAGNIPTLYGGGKFHFTNADQSHKSPPLVLMSIAPGVPLRKFETNAQVKTGWTKQKLADLYKKLVPIFTTLHGEIIEKCDAESFHVDPKTLNPCVFDFDRAILKSESACQSNQDIITLTSLFRGILKHWGLK